MADAILNKDFENWTAGLPDSWTWDAGASHIAQETVVVYSGLSSAKVRSNTNDGWGILEQQLDAIPIRGQGFTFTVWLRTAGPSSTNTQIKIVTDGAVPLNVATFWSGALNTWLQFSVNGVIPLDATYAKLRIMPFSAGFPPGPWYYVDLAESIPASFFVPRVLII